MIAPVVVTGDELLKVLLQLPGQVVITPRHLLFHGSMPTLDLAPGLWMRGRPLADDVTQSQETNFGVCSGFHIAFR